MGMCLDTWVMTACVLLDLSSHQCSLVSARAGFELANFIPPKTEAKTSK